MLWKASLASYLAVSLVWVATASAQSNFGIRFLTDAYVSGQFRDHKMYDHYCYVANEYGVLVYDLSDPAHPQVVNRVRTQGCAKDLAIAGDRLYVAEEGYMFSPSRCGISTFSIADPANPRLLGYYRTRSTPVNIATQDSLLLMIAEDRPFQSIYLFDATDPERLIALDSLDCGRSEPQIQLTDTLLYIDAGNLSSFYSISDPRNIDSLCSFRLADTTLFVVSYIEIYGGGGWHNDYNNLFRFNLMDLERARMPYGCKIPDYLSNRTLKRENYLYISTSSNLTVVETGRDRLSVVSVTDWSAYHYGSSIELHNGILCLLHAHSILVFDASSPYEINYLGMDGFQFYIDRVLICNGYAYLVEQKEVNATEGPYHLITVSLDQRDSPEETDREEVPNSVTAMYQKGSYLYLFCSGRIVNYDLTDPSNPVQVNSLGLHGFSADGDRVIGEGDLVYVAGAYGICTVSLADPLNPVLLDVDLVTFPPYNPSNHIGEIDDHYLYSPGRQSLVTFERSEDGTLEQHEIFEGLAWCEGFHRYGDYYYITRQNGQLCIVQFNEDRTAYEIVRETNISLWPQKLCGQYLIGRNSTEDLCVVSLVDTLNPRLVGRCNNAGWGWQLDVDEERQTILVANGYSLDFYDYSEALEVENGGDQGTLPSDQALTITPNPVNSSARIRYSLPKDELIQVGVSDVSGHLVTKLFNGVQTRGTHEVVLETTALPAGLYVVWLEGDSRVMRNKLVVVK